MQAKGFLQCSSSKLVTAPKFSTAPGASNVRRLENAVVSTSGREMPSTTSAPSASNCLRRSCRNRGTWRKACPPLHSLMWDGSGGEMTLSEQLLSLREGSEYSLEEGDAQTAKVNFHLRYKTNFGQGVKLIGSDPKLGNWDIRHALEMTYTPGDQWVASVELTAGGVYEYKYVIINYETKEALEWQNGSNAVLAIIVDDTEVEVFDNWGNNPGAMVRINNESTTREGKLQRWAGYMGGFWKEAKRLQGELMQKNGENQGLRNELSQLRMELSLEQQARNEVLSQMKDLKVENASLKNRLAQKTVELNRTLSEVLDMLDAGMLDEEAALHIKDEAAALEEDEDSQWLLQRGLGSHQAAHDFSSSSHSSGYQARPASASDFLFGEIAAAEGQGLEPYPRQQPLVGWEADAEAQAQAARLGSYDHSSSSSSSSSSRWSWDQQGIESSIDETSSPSASRSSW